MPPNIRMHGIRKRGWKSGYNIYCTPFQRKAKSDEKNLVLTASLILGLIDGQDDEEIAPTATHMYWTDSGTSKIQRTNLNGSNVQDLVTQLDNPVDIALNVPRR